MVSRHVRKRAKSLGLNKVEEQYTQKMPGFFFIQSYKTHGVIPKI